MTVEVEIGCCAHRRRDIGSELQTNLCRQSRSIVQTSPQKINRLLQSRAAHGKRVRSQQRATQERLAGVDVDFATNRGITQGGRYASSAQAKDQVRSRMSLRCQGCASSKRSNFVISSAILGASKGILAVIEGDATLSNQLACDIGPRHHQQLAWLATR
jgi:hypothetical protein